MRSGTKERLSAFSRVLAVVMAIITGLYPGLYFLQDRRFSLLAFKDTTILLDTLWNILFYLHIICAGLSLLMGWMQFPEYWRLRRPAWHRSLGKSYIGLSLAGSASGIYLAFFATGGWVSGLGFALLGIFWFYTSLMAFINARKNRILRHRKMAFYSYAACFAAVTLRLWLQLLLYTGLDFIVAYKIVAWLSWLPNIMVANILWRKKYDIAPLA